MSMKPQRRGEMAGSRDSDTYYRQSTSERRLFVLAVAFVQFAYISLAYTEQNLHGSH
jgi:hypothetical protein